MRAIAFLNLAVPAALVAALPSAASARSTPALGGGGGGEFQSGCPINSYMIGVSGRTGAWIDAIQPVCARWNVRTQQLDSAGRGPLAGGNGGGPNTKMCAYRQAVSGWEIGQRRYGGGVVVHWVRLRCKDLQPEPAGEGLIRERFGSYDDTPNGDWADHRCPPGELATGIYGRHGAFLDRAGLFCDKGLTMLPFPEVVR